MISTIIHEVGIIICDIGLINVKFYLLEVRRITHFYIPIRFFIYQFKRQRHVIPRDGNGADRDRIMGDPNPPRTCTTNTRPRPAPAVGATYPAPFPPRPENRVIMH